MTDQEPRKIFNWQHYGLIFLGLIIFVLLFFAEKTSLNNPPEATENRGKNVTSVNVKPGDLFGSLPKIANDSLADQAKQIIDGKITSADTIQAIIDNLRSEGAYLHATLCAEKLASSEPTAKNYFVAGVISRTSLQSQSVAKDTALFRIFASKSISLLQKSVELDSTNENAMIELAMAYLESRIGMNSMEGIKMFRRVLNLNPNNEEAAFHLARGSRQIGKTDQAIELYQKVVELNPGNLEAKWELAGMLVDGGRNDEAAGLLSDLKNQEVDPMLAGAAGDLLEKLKK